MNKPQAVPMFHLKKAYTPCYIDFRPSSYVVFDTETTGLNPSLGQIIEIGAIKYINHEKTEIFNYLINPKTDLDPYITELTGIKQVDLINQPTIDEILPKFYEFVDDLPLIAHNASFDMQMVAAEAYRLDMPLLTNPVIDTVTIARLIFPKDLIKNHRLPTIKAFLGLANHSHRALDDCETTSSIYQYYYSLINEEDDNQSIYSLEGTNF